jgi:hypothetical protein
MKIETKMRDHVTLAMILFSERQRKSTGEAVDKRYTVGGNIISKPLWKAI